MDAAVFHLNRRVSPWNLMSTNLKQGFLKVSNEKFSARGKPDPCDWQINIEPAPQVNMYIL